MKSRFWIDAIERTARTAVQAAAAAVLALWIQAGSFTELDWNALWQVSLFAAGFTVLTALAARPVGNPGDASFIDPKQ
jgi:ABC-type enterobactin transport system permease subunit